MMTEQVAAAEGEVFKVANATGGILMISDLRTDPTDRTDKSFEFKKGEKTDLAMHFSSIRLRASRDLKRSIDNGELVKLDDADEMEEPFTLGEEETYEKDGVESKLPEGKAPINEFDKKLVKLERKEKEIEERQKPGSTAGLTEEDLAALEGK